VQNVSFYYIVSFHRATPLEGVHALKAHLLYRFFISLFSPCSRDWHGYHRTMPVGQGRPDAACPFSTNDDTVRFTQGDLFLCPECEEFRLPNNPSGKSGKGKGTRKQQAHTGASSRIAQHTSDHHTLDQFAKGVCQAATCIASGKPAAML
jgi:hypothetical protein